MRALLALLVLAAGCHHADLEPGPLPGHAGRPDVPRLLGPSSVTIHGALPVGAWRRGFFTAQEGMAIGFVTDLPEGSAVLVALDAEPPAEIFVYGPLTDEGWFAAAPLARDGGTGELPVMAYDGGRYLVAAMGPPGASSPFLLSLHGDSW